MVQGLYRGLYRDNGKEHGNGYLGLRAEDLGFAIARYDNHCNY